MKILFFILTFLFVNGLLAEGIDVLVEPNEPIVNEPFFITFKLKATGGDEPYISFTPNGASVLGKRSQGLSISTTVINGKITTTKEQAIVYELQAERVGQVYLRNIKVEVNGKTTNVKEVRVNVLSEPKRIPEAFIEAEASKTRVYVGEGLDVNYYLYFKGSISANDVKEFPKLNKFIKRFHHVNSPVETVQYKGQVLKRILAYSARLYPEKAGSAVLDPMKISVQIPEIDYSGFGFGSQRYKNKDLSSSRIEIEVLPLPVEGVPKSFGGLVGEHEMTISIPKSKFLVNEPIEIKLEVKGRGAVENFDAPVIYEDNNLEQFDTKSEVSELGFQAAKKVFEYTLLARAPLKIPPGELEYSYFDPSSNRYITKKISIPSLVVDGVASPDSPNSTIDQNQTTKTAEPSVDFLNSFLAPKEKRVVNLGLISPRFYAKSRIFDHYISFFNYGLSLILLVVLIPVFRGLLNEEVKTFNKEARQEFKNIKKKGLTYASVYRLLSHLDSKKRMSSGGISIVEVINESSLTLESKEYFKRILASLEAPNYSNKNSQIAISKPDMKYFKELMKKV
jgi:hypothetical protein